MDVFQVEQGGLFTTIQDLGRPGHQSAGIPPGGAMDRFALAAANVLVGNDKNTAALECTLEGPALVAKRSCLVAVAGADLGFERNGQPVPTWTGLFVGEGDRLSFSGRRTGAYAYLAVSGGLDAERWLGSASTYPLIGRGGIHGRPLKAGDTLALAGQSPNPVIAGRHLAVADRPHYTAEPELRVVPGPHGRRLGPQDRKVFYSASWMVSQDADRKGYCLEGPELGVIKNSELFSFGVTVGCIQLPSSGRAIVLMAEHQTTGEHPVVGTVIRADLCLAAQLLPGEHLQFREASAEEGHEAWQQQRQVLEAFAMRGAHALLDHSSPGL
jgi:antagonist of KipI